MFYTIQYNCYQDPAITKIVYAHAALAIPKTVTYYSVAICNHADPAVTKAVYVHESPIGYGQLAFSFLSFGGFGFLFYTFLSCFYI